MAEENFKRLNILVPVELYEKFDELSHDEYRSTTGMVTDWMAEFVKTRKRDIESLHERQLQTAIARFSSLLLRYASDANPNKSSEYLRKLAKLMLEIGQDPASWDTPTFQNKIAEMDAL
jgi:hypothetical protein